MFQWLHKDFKLSERKHRAKKAKKFARSYKNLIMGFLVSNLGIRINPRLICFKNESKFLIQADSKMFSKCQTRCF